MPRTRTLLFLVYLPLLALLLGWQLGARYESNRLSEERDRIAHLFSGRTGSGQVVQNDPEKEVDISLLWSVWRLLDQYYLHQSDLKVNKLVFGAVSGMVAAVDDPYTVFMMPSDSKEFTDSLHGTLEGIGAQLEIRSGEIIVVSPLKGSPAEKAGLRPLDIILTVSGKDVTGMKLDDVVTMVRGKSGTSVTLTVGRKGEEKPITFKIVRERIHIPSVETKVMKTASGSIGLVVLNQFGDDSTAEVRKALLSLKNEKLKGAVLDLRYNGGGYLESAIDIVSMFVREGRVVSVERRNKPTEELTAFGSPIFEDIPLVVLINGGSASASEIVAGALQDLKRTTIVGMQSFGKGTVQEVIDLPGGSSLRVTTAKWLTPSGHDLSKKGVTPDITVDRSIEQYRAEVDPQMVTAIEWLTDKEDISKQFATNSSSSSSR